MILGTVRKALRCAIERRRNTEIMSSSIEIMLPPDSRFIQGDGSTTSLEVSEATLIKRELLRLGDDIFVSEFDLSRILFPPRRLLVLPPFRDLAGLLMCSRALSPEKVRFLE